MAKYLILTKFRFTIVHTIPVRVIYAIDKLGTEVYYIQYKSNYVGALWQRAAVEQGNGLG